MNSCQARLITLFAMVLLYAINTNFASAQVLASISGRIEDSSGAAIPEATVAVTSLETGAARTVATDEAGNYRVLSLPVGRYEVRTEKPGFKAVVQTGINLVVGQQAVVNFSLEVGEVKQEVTVTGEAPLVNTTTASVAGLVGEKQVKDLPLNGRSFDNLITLNSGAVNATPLKTTGAYASQIGNLFSVSGRRPSENLFLLNGVEYTGPNQTHALPGGVSGQLLGIDAVREFNSVSDAYSAEYGKRAGAQVSIVTQSGTNRFHGSVFEFLRNSDMDARNFYDHGSVPPFKRNQFGAAAGGPFQKDRTFFFTNYEGFRQRLGLSDVSIVPDDNARKGLLPDAQGVPAPVAGLVPGMLPYMAYWPEPNGPNLGGGLTLAYSNPKQSIREDFGNLRLDRTISTKDSLSGIYTVDDGYSENPAANPLFGTVNNLRSQVLSVHEVRLFSPNVINTFTAGLSRVGWFFNTPALGDFPANLSFVRGEIPGNLNVGGGLGVGNSITPAGSASTAHFKNYKTILTYSDGMQIIRGRHQISLGAWFEDFRSNEYGNSGQTGRASFGSLLSFLQGNVATFLVVPTPTPHHYKQLEGAWYVQDAIQVRPNLTLRLGLRHEFTNGWNDPTGKASNFIFDSNGVLLTTPRVGTSVLTKNNAKWLFGPRIGLAWDPFGKGRTSIRVGIGTYYSIQDALGFAFKDNPPFNGTSSFANVPFLSIVPVDPRIPVPPVCGPAVPQPCTTYQYTGIQPNFKTPTVEEWNLAIEQQITLDTSLRISYVGSRGFHQLNSMDINSIAPQICNDASGCISGGVGTARGTVPKGAEYIPVGKRPNPYLSSGFDWFSLGNTNYNAMRLDLTHRFSSGLQFRANYAWQKDLNLGSLLTSTDASNESFQIMNPYDPGRDWGPSSQDFRHQFSFSGSYELPFARYWFSGASGVAGKLAGGWQLNWILPVTTGFALTPQVGANQSGNGDTRTPDRPSANPNFTGPIILGNPNRWFNPNAYVLPTPGTWGNVGRGVLRTPDLAALDLSLFKTTSVREGMTLQFRAEFFNILNRANFGSPNNVIFNSGRINPSAGLVTNTTTTSRQIQFGLKLNF